MTALPRDIDGGRYRLLERVGRGAYGEVFRGIQVSVDRVVAIKLVHPHLEAQADVASRFRREARLTSRLNHPSAVRVIDFGDADGSLYLVMEFVDGPTLKAVLAEHGPLPPERVRHIVRQIAGALGAAHDIALVHRDLKPANVLIAAGDRPVVIDFGLVKVFAGDDDAGAVTRTNVMVGTPSYVSPEAVFGRALDGRADLFALGVLTYELLTGRRPFTGRTALEVATARLHAAPAPLPDDAPADLRRLVTWLLATSPDDRPDSAAEVVRFLDDPDAFPRVGDATSEAESAMDATVAPTRGPGAAPELDAARTDATTDRQPAPAAAEATTRAGRRHHEPSATRRYRSPTLLAAAAVVIATLAALVLSVVPDRGDAEEPNAGTAGPAVASTRGSDPATPPADPGAPRPYSETGAATGVRPVPAAEPAQPVTDEEALGEAVAPRVDGQPPLGDAAPGAVEGAPAGPAREHPADGGRSSAAAPEPAAPAEAAPPRRSTGTLTVNIEPWGDVWVDEEPRGEAPVRDLVLEVGTHTVRTRYMDQEREERVTVEQGRSTSIAHRYRR